MKAGDLVSSKYRIVSRLGIGGMGTVWSASHVHTEREFAIKLLHPAVAAGNEEARQRFLQEARASARVNHPNIIDIFDVGENDDGTLYLVMELLEGISLADALRADPPFSVRELLVLLVGAGTALAAAHNAGIIHRDIKPPNIYLHRDRSSGLVRPKVLDFGVSKVALGDDGVSTQLGSLLGSPRYMAPEQAISATQADARADLWSFGVILFESLTGEYPHVGDSSNAIVIAIATTPPRRVRDLPHHAGLPASLLDLVDDLLKPTSARVQTADELVARMNRVLAENDLANIPLARPQAVKRFVNRPENFVIQTFSNGTSGMGVSSMSGIAVSAARMGSIPGFTQGPGGRPLPPPTPVRPTIESTGDEEPDTATIARLDAVVSGGTVVLTPSANQRSPVAPPTPSQPGVAAPPPRPGPGPGAAATPLPGVDPSESISSINVARGLMSAPPFAPTHVDSLPPPPPSRMRLWIALALVGLFTVIGAIVIVATAESGDPAAAASSQPSSRPAAPVVRTSEPTAVATVSAAPSASVASSAAVAVGSATAKRPTNAVGVPTTATTGTAKPVDPLRDLGSGISVPKKK